MLWPPQEIYFCDIKLTSTVRRMSNCSPSTMRMISLSLDRLSTGQFGYRLL